MVTPQDIKKAFEDLKDMIQQAESDTRAGKEIDLGDLDLEVSKLCGAAKDLPPEASEIVHDPMLEMISALETLAHTLKDVQESEE